MKNITQQAAIQQLKTEIQQVIKTASSWQELPLEVLNWKTNQGSWSVLECLAHLNYYTDYYLDHGEKQLKKNAQKVAQSKPYQSSWLGNYFCKMVAPTNLKKTKTLAHLNPVGGTLGVHTLHTFLEHQQQFLNIMDRAQHYDLIKNKVPLEFFKLIRLRLGDVFRFLVAHEQRHILQAQRVIEHYEQQAIKSLS